MEVLITGASGFVGRNLQAYLADNFDIRTLSLRYGDPVKLDSQIEHVIHLSGKAHDLKHVSDPSSYYKANFEISKSLYDAFLNSEARNFIYISSVKSVADTVDEILIENVIPDPQTHYGRSKLMAENYMLSQPLPKGKSYYILRPCMIHGPGNKGNLNLLYKLIHNGIPYPLGAFENNRSFLSVDNLCFIIKELILRDDIPVGVYNVSDDDPMSTNEVVSIISFCLDKKPRLWNIPPSFIFFLAKIGDRFHLPFTTERLKKLTENYIVSNKKIKEAINKELPLSSEAGLKLTAESFQKS
jgi:nucleoside-diphosphate-sugar epimerase